MRFFTPKKLEPIENLAKKEHGVTDIEMASLKKLQLLRNRQVGGGGGGGNRNCNVLSVDGLEAARVEAVVEQTHHRIAKVASLQEKHRCFRHFSQYNENNTIKTSNV